MMDLTSAGILEPHVSDGRVGRAAGLWLTDTLPSERFPLYTRLNANDVLPDPVTPLGATLAWIPHILPGWVAGYVALGAFAPEEFGSDAVAPNAGFFYGRLYVNQTMVRIMGIRSGIGWQAIDSAFFSSDAPAHRDQPSDVNQALSAGMAQRTTWVLTATTFPDLDEEWRIADDCRAGRPDLASLSAAALVARARSVMPLERLMWRGHTIASSCAPVGPSVITQLVGADHASLVVWLIGNAGDVDSAAPSFALWDLSRAVRDDDAVSKEFDDGLDGLIDRLRTGQPQFAARLAGFLADYGYRGPSEWDLGSDSWETQPGLPLGLVDRLRQLPDDAAPGARAATREADTAAALQQALDIVGDNPEAVESLHTAIASARRFAAWRERGKTNCIKVLHEARVALLELGRRLHAEDHLSSPRQVFMALESELDRLVADPASMTSILDQRDSAVARACAPAGTDLRAGRATAPSALSAAAPPRCRSGFGAAGRRPAGRPCVARCRSRTGPSDTHSGGDRRPPARRNPRGAADRSVLGAAVPGVLRRRRRRRRNRQPRHDHQPRTRHPVRRGRHRRNPTDHDRRDSRGRRIDRHGSNSCRLTPVRPDTQ
jgi:rifampicin phosphotransferase